MFDFQHLDQTAFLPALFIVGAPRCGTTALAGALTQHSRIVFSVPKEPRFLLAGRLTATRPRSGGAISKPISRT
jgi:hypothetical protein